VYILQKKSHNGIREEMRKIVKEKKKSRGKVHVDKDIFFSVAYM